MHIILSHGRGGSPNDAIIKKLSQTCQSLEFSYEAIDDEDCQNPDIRSQRLIDKVGAIDPAEKIILVGFSMGGYTSVLAAEKHAHVYGLFLIAPGLYLPRYTQRQYRNDLKNIEIIHGWSDNIVLYEHSLRFANDSGATLHLMPGSHMLLSQLDKIATLFKDYLLRLTDK